MSIKSFVRDPFVEKVLAGLTVVAIGGLVAWAVGGWPEIFKAWDFIQEPTQLPRYVIIVLGALSSWLIILKLRARLKNRGPIYFTDDDCIAQLIDFIGDHAEGIGGEALNYKALDEQLRLVPGATKRHIQTAAMHYRYSARVKGDQSIVFESL